MPPHAEDRLAQVSLQVPLQAPLRPAPWCRPVCTTIWRQGYRFVSRHRSLPMAVKAQVKVAMKFVAGALTWPEGLLISAAGLALLS